VTLNFHRWLNHDGRYASKACILILVALVIITGPCYALNQEQARLKQLRDQIGQLQNSIKHTKDEHSQLNRQLEESEQQIGRLAQRLRVLSGRLKRQEQHLIRLQHDEAKQKSDLDIERKALAEQVRAAYAVGRQGRLKLLLNQQDPDRLSRVFAYYDFFNRARVQRMQRINDRLVALNELRLKIDSEEMQLRVLHEKKKQEKLALEQTQGTRLGVLKALKSDLLTQDRQLKQLKRDEQRLSDLLAGLQKALSDIPMENMIEKAFSQRKGQIAWPSKGKLVASYGSSKVGNMKWDGVMISASEGGEIYAVHPGRVAYADWLRGYGLLLILDHGDGWMTLYGHNQSLFKETGDWVAAGEPLAAIGNSGGREDYGVYFGIRQNGKAVDPLSWCRRIKGGRTG